MKRKNIMTAVALSLCTLGITSCVDSSYDLSDIDNTAQIDINNLVIPMNIESLSLEQALDIDDDSEIEKDTIYNADGTINYIQYAISKSGSFESKPIDIKNFNIKKPTTESKTSTLQLTDLRTAAIYKGEGIAAYYDITDQQPSHFKSEAQDFDKAIKYIKSVGVTGTLVNTATIVGLNSQALKSVKVEGMKVQFPKGFIATADKGVYDTETGILDLTKEVLIPNSKGEITCTLTVTGIDVEKSNAEVDYKNHSLVLEDEIHITEGKVNIYADETLPDEMQIVTKPDVSEININTFTGKIEYEVEDFDIDPININNIPDILNQSGTSISLENPQIYLSLNNPVSDYPGVYFETGMNITSVRDSKSQTYSLDNGTFRTSGDKTEYKYILAPTATEPAFEGFDEATYVKFSSLKNVLADVDGIPTQLKVDAVAPKLPEQDITDFKLGTTIDPVKGDYMFYSPLDIGKGSKIKYFDNVTGWDNGDLQKMVLDKVKFNFDLTTEIPFEIELEVYPLDTKGNKMEGVKSTTAKASAYAQNEPVELIITGNIENLDGIQVDARLVSGITDTLLPSMPLHFKNFKATVNGYYKTEF